jgi:hypothetical protein
MKVIQELPTTPSFEMMSANTVFDRLSKVTVAPQSFERLGCYG